ncbi:uncharacterized protein LOC130719516 [Lotus japonicus]|uniref:uncharacterized protein LOC130719516 n=1 Tax=Lotus japonicus TaxID=34305 RepID=UPI0025831C5B|nr:uncharacterized protein LOC130719516 [Lotus japonicus]
MEWIEEVGLLKTVTGITRCYDKLVKEFIVNVTTSCNVSGSPDFRKVFVRGKCVNFSPSVINTFLGRSLAEIVDEEISLSAITTELTADQVKEWPVKGLLSSAHLSVKYAILNRIGAANWAPTKHTSNVSSGLAKLIYLIGTKAKFDFGAYVFDQTVKHAETLAVKLPIGFPYLISEIILSQQPQIVTADEFPNKKASALTVDHRLLDGTHVPDVAGLAEITQGEDTISSCTLRKKHVDCLIMELTKGKNTDEDNAVAGDQAVGGATSDDDSAASS